MNRFLLGIPVFFILLATIPMCSSDMIRAMDAEAAIEELEQQDWEATAYCKGKHTFSGVKVERGMIASDPKVLPLGSVVRLSTFDHKYDGIYSVVDTGPAIKGHILDLYMWSCYEALDFGRRDVRIEILRMGWNPNPLGLR